MQLTILGAGTIAPDLKHTQSGYLLQMDGRGPILFDCGPGKILRLMELGIDCWTIAKIFVTHFHLDHIGDLPSVLFSKINPTHDNNSDLAIYGPPGTKAFRKKIRAFFPSMFKSPLYKLDFQPFPIDEGWSDGDLQISAYPMNHSMETYGYRVEGPGGIFAYSGDTDMCDQVVELGRDADLFLLECSLPTVFKMPGHLTPKEVGAIGAKSECKHLVLTHLYPALLEDPENALGEIRETYSGKLTLAEDLLTLPVS